MTQNNSASRTAVDNRRRHPRQAIRHDLIVGVKGVEQRLTMTDLSVKGAFIETDLPLRPGDELPLVVQHHAYHGSAHARIMWGNGRGFGISFTKAGRDFDETVEAILTAARSKRE